MSYGPFSVAYENDIEVKQNVRTKNGKQLFGFNSADQVIYPEVAQSCNSDLRGKLPPKC